MDKIFYNGVIKTVDSAYPYVEAIAVDGKVIMHVGSNEEILKYKTADTQLIDLEGKFMYPGFYDSHMHMVYGAYMDTRLDLGACKTFKEVLDVLHEEALRIKAAGSDEWVVGVNFNQDDWEDKKEVPNRLDLDSISEGLPVYILRCCGHTASHSTKALEIIGLLNETRETKHNMKFFEDGTPQGQTFEKDAELADPFFPKPGKDEYRAWIKEYSKKYASMGLVGIHSDDFNLVNPGKDVETAMQAFKEAAEAGEMSIHVYEQCRVETPELVKEFAEKYPHGTTFGKDKMFKTVAFKEMMDGSLGAHSGYMRYGYKNDPDAANVSVHTDEDINEIVKMANKYDYPVVAHCIGDGAVQQLLNAFEYSQNFNKKANIRNGVVHCQIMGFDQLDRMQRDNVLAYCQPVFVGTDAAIVDDCVGVEIGKQSYNWRKMWDLGIHVSDGSDCPVESNDPINNIYYAVTRDSGNGTPWNPECAMTMEEAIKAATIEAAYAAYEEAVRGSITAGKYADLVVLDKNLMEIDPSEIRDTKVLMTVVDGKIVYEA